MTKTFTQEFIDKAQKKGYNISSDRDGTLRVSDLNHGVITLRAINSNGKTTLDLSKNSLATETFVDDITQIFEEVIN